MKNPRLQDFGHQKLQDFGHYSFLIYENHALNVYFLWEILLNGSIVCTSINKPYT